MIILWKHLWLKSDATSKKKMINVNVHQNPRFVYQTLKSGVRETETNNIWNDNVQKSRATFDGKAILKRNLDIFLWKPQYRSRPISGREQNTSQQRKPIMCHHDSKKGRRRYAFSSTVESHRGQVNRETSRFLSNPIRNTPLFLIFRPRR